MSKAKNIRLKAEGPAGPSSDWRADLPKDWTVVHRDESGQEVEIPLREHPALAKYGSKDEAVKALVHAQRLLGKRPEGWVEVPGEDAGAEQREAFFAAIGRPESAEGYEFPDLDELPEGFELNEELRGMFRDKAFELGLTPGQVRGLYEWFVPLNLAAAAEMDERGRRRRSEELEALRSVHRGETGRVLDDARQAALALGGEDLLGALEDTGAGDRREVINALARVAPLVLEGRIRGVGQGQGRGLSLAKLREMMRDPRYCDQTRRDPEFVDQVVKGFEALFPGQYRREARV
ncbi:MAG: hypothetical protein JW718_05185 [Desulfovibrionaceae bacterium]|nr:hypothetical protein [Desulfovibrionaceae bacterium]